MPAFNPVINQTDIDAIRYQLETIGFAEYTVMANNFDDTPAALATVDGVSLGTTFPVPPDCTVLATINGAVYTDAGTDTGEIFGVAVLGFRDGVGNVVAGDAVGGSGAVATLFTQQSSATGATAGITVAAAADTTNQGIDVTLASFASSASYAVARVRLICTKKGGFYKKYRT